MKFYRRSRRASVEFDAGPFADGFHHVDDWVPQRLVTASGPNPLPAMTDLREECEGSAGGADPGRWLTGDPITQPIRRIIRTLPYARAGLEPRALEAEIDRVRHDDEFMTRLRE